MTDYMEKKDDQKTKPDWFSEELEDDRREIDGE